MNEKLIKNINKKADRIIWRIKIKLIIASKLGKRHIMYARRRSSWNIDGKEDTYLVDLIYEKLKNQGFKVNRDVLPIWNRIFIGY